MKNDRLYYIKLKQSLRIMELLLLVICIRKQRKMTREVAAEDHEDDIEEVTEVEKEKHAKRC